MKRLIVLAVLSFYFVSSSGYPAYSAPVTGVIPTDNNCLADDAPFDPTIDKAIFSVSGIDIFNPYLYQSQSTNQVEITNFTKERIAGRIQKGRLILLFEARRTRNAIYLSVTTGSGRELILVKEDGSDLTASVLNGKLKARSKISELEKLRQTVKSARLAEPIYQTVRNTETIAEAVRRTSTVQGDATVLNDLKRSQEYALLPALSKTLGDLGVEGRIYPPATGLHAIAVGASQLTGVAPSQPGVSYLIKLPPGIRPNVRDLRDMIGGWYPSDCWNPQSGPNYDQLPICEGRCESYPNRDQGCFGMCGPGCSDCWEWVCGDCCYHRFCAVHDAMLRSCADSFNPAACFAAIAPWYYIVTGC